MSNRAGRDKFFDKLIAMNWVEREVKTTSAVESGIDFLWQQLAGTIRDVVESYNNHYGQENGEVSVEPNGRSLWLKRRRCGRYGEEELVDAGIQITINKANPSFTASGPLYDYKVNLAVSDNYEKIYPVNETGKEISPDEVSRVLVYHFLFDPLYSKKRVS